MKTMSPMGERLITNVGADSKILTWTIVYANVFVNRHLVGRGGKTAYERLKGKTSKMIGTELAETVTLRRVPIPGRLVKLESFWEPRAASVWSSTRRECVRHKLRAECRPEAMDDGKRGESQSTHRGSFRTR